MAVSEVIEHATGGSGAGEGTGSETAKVSFRTVHLVKCDDPSDTSHTVFVHFRSTSSLPWFGRQFRFGNDSDGSTFCRTLNVDRIPNSGGMFLAKATYEPAEGGGSGTPGSITGTRPDGRETTNPLQWRDEIQKTYTQISAPAAGGTFRRVVGGGGGGVLRPGRFGAVMNSAGIPFDPPPEEEIEITILRITKYVPRCNGFDRFIGTINKDHVVIDKPTYRFHQEFSPFVGKLHGVDQQFFINDGIKCWKQTVEVHLNPLGWRRQILDQGTEELLRVGDTDDDGNILSTDDFPTNRNWDHFKVKDTEGYPVVAPVLLDGKGRRLKPDAAAVFLEYSLGPGEVAFGFFNGVAW